MNNLLEQAIEIPIAQYIELKNPIFKGQTKLDKDNKYFRPDGGRIRLCDHRCDPPHSGRI